MQTFHLYELCDKDKDTNISTQYNNILFHGHDLTNLYFQFSFPVTQVISNNCGFIVNRGLLITPVVK